MHGIISGGVAGGSTLLTDLLSWWSLDEASGTRADSHGSNDLTDVNTVGQATGKVNDAGNFVAANLEVLSLASPNNLSDADRDFTFATWVYLDSPSGFSGIARAGSSTAATAHNWLLLYDVSSSRFQFYVVDNVTWKLVTANNFGAPSASTWYLLIGEFDAVAGTIGLSVNNGTMDTTTGVSTPSSTSRNFELGLYSTYYWDGRIDEAAYWSRLLTTDEKSELWNSSNGIGYPG